jgi:hypothetical protein
MKDSPEDWPLKAPPIDWLREMTLARVPGPHEDPCARTILAAFANEGILFDPQDPNDHRHLIDMKWAIGTWVNEPSDHVRYQMTGVGRDPCDTRTPVVEISDAITHLLYTFQSVTAAACVEAPPDRVNVAERMMEHLRDYGPDLFQVLRKLNDIHTSAQEALSVGEPMSDNRPRNLVYDWFVQALAEIYQVKTGESPLTKAGKAKTSFARIVQGSQSLLPEALRGRDLAVVRDRATAALKR